jgi:photosynthetic reaction center cytochrome c subunit
LIFATFPATRKGSAGDVANINCASCHQGAFKPFYGQSMLKDYPALMGSPASAPMPGASAPLATGALQASAK